MIRLGKTVLALAALAALSGCGGESWEWRQKLTLVVEGPEGETSGAAVTLVSWGDVDSFGNYPGGYAGEATVTEVAPGRHVFALLSENTRYLATYGVFPDIAGGVGRGPFETMSKYRGERAVPPRHYPLLVTFTDIADPKTVKRVDPDDLDAAFGLCPDGTGLNDAEAPWRAAGLIWRRWARWQASGLTLDAYKAKYESNPGPGWIEALDRKVTPRDRSGDCRRLKAMTLAIVDEPVTKGRVESVLGWWLTLRGGPYNSMQSIRLPDDSPRGWENLSPLAFWSLDRIQEFDRRYK